jgi:maleate isomerase
VTGAWASTYGHAARFGVIVPSNNTVIEPELWRMRAPGTTFHAQRVRSYGNTPEAIVQMERGVADAISVLAPAGFDALAYACLATSLVKGRAWNAQVEERMVRDASAPATSAASATLAALHALGARRVAVATPYRPQVQACVAPYFRDAGIEVVSEAALDAQDSFVLWRTTPHQLRELVARLELGSAQAMCLLATDLPCCELIAELEQSTGLPVVSTNQAILWQLQRSAGIATSVAGFGRLLTLPPQEARA